MFIFYILILLLVVLSVKRAGQQTITTAFDRHTTVSVQGIFVCLVFLRHVREYKISSGYELLDKLFVLGNSCWGQLIVCMFFFYSGYGIMMNIKNSDTYIKAFPKRRIGTTYINFAVCIALYCVMNFILHREYGVGTILLAFLGLKSIGNSNWFMFCIFVLYIITLIVYRLPCEMRTRMQVCFGSVCVFIVVMSFVMKGEGWWYNTLISYPYGMYVAMNLEKYDDNSPRNRLSVNAAAFLVCFAVYYLLRYVGFEYEYLYEFVSIFFINIILIASKKLCFKNNFFYVLGKYTFWMYMLQRMVFIILFGYLDVEHSIFMVAVSFGIVCCLAILMGTLMNKLRTLAGQRK